MRVPVAQSRFCVEARGLVIAVAGAVAAWAANAPEACAQVVTLTPVADNTLFLNVLAPNELLSNGAGDGLFSGQTYVHASYTHRALIRFDVSAVPVGAVISAVSLTMTVDRAPRFQPDTPVRLHRVTAAWGEGLSSSFGGTGSVSQLDDANWYERRNPGVMWTNPGGDFVPTASATKLVGSATGQYAWDSTAALIADVAFWVSNPASNFGWILLNDESNIGTTRKFSSRQASNPALWPQLAISFSTPATCLADVASDSSDEVRNSNGSVGPEDIEAFVNGFVGENASIADVAADSADTVYNPNGTVGPEDIEAFVNSFIAGC